MEFFDILRQKNKEDLRKFVGDKAKNPEWTKMLKDIKPFINVSAEKIPAKEDLDNFYKKYANNTLVDYFLFFFTQQFEHEHIVVPSEKAEYFEKLFNVFKSSFNYKKIRPLFFRSIGQVRKEMEIRQMRKKPFTYEQVRKQLDESTLSPVLKNDLLDWVDGATLKSIQETGGVLCLTETCLKFLRQEGYRTWGITEEEDPKLDNYLRKYFYEKLKGFPALIMTRNNTVLFDPIQNPEYKDEDMPVKHTATGKYYVKVKYSESECGDLNFYSDFLSYEDCKYIKMMFFHNQIETLKDKEFYIKNIKDYYSNFERKIEIMEKFKETIKLVDLDIFPEEHFYDFQL